MIASFFINVITSAVDPTLSSSDITFLLKQTKPKVIFVALDAVTTIEAVIDNLDYALTVVVFGETQKYIAFSDILASYGDEIENFKPSTAENLREIALICFSSGTSGLPKPAAHSHYGLMYSYANNVHSAYNFGLSFGFYSPYWTLFSHGLGTCVSQGTTRLILPKFDASNPWEPFHHEVTTSVLNVYQAIKLLSVKKPEGLNTSSLSTLVLTGGIISNDQLLKVKDLFPGTLICNVYGQSEVAGYLTQFRLSSLSDLEIFCKKVWFGWYWTARKFV
ncbi:hypothetical protein RI129_000151 [Pyrocoelia pectoralis]|uniref:Medium-chain acyl-CoA ligase ACSF2, mitochondrial n=1 Tax=Pyrocoelia pectoralis TaxID=417401 RepID=A0AAN7ZFJ5_9COLE